MRSRLAFSSATALASILLIAAPAFADEPAPAPATDPAAPTAQPPPSEPPATPPAAPPAAPPESAAGTATATAEPPLSTVTTTPPDAPGASAGDADVRRGEGMRLGLDLGFQRAFDGATDRLNHGTPTLLPVGLEVGLRTSPGLLVALRGYAALASRDDCISADSCRARAYGVSVALEGPLARGKSFVPWIRYAAGYELVYQGGAPLDPAGHTFRGAFDLLDLRVGGDFIVGRGTEGKTTRLGVFLGFVGGFLTRQSGVSYTGRINNPTAPPNDFDRGSGSAHLWFVMGVRGTLDP